MTVSKFRRALLLALAPWALADCSANPSPRAPSQQVLAESGAAALARAADHWDCVAGELEVSGREDARNMLGPRSALRARSSRCGGFSMDGERARAQLPTPANPGLAPLDVSDLLQLAVALDGSMRLELSENGALEVRSPVRRKLVKRLYRTHPSRRPAIALDLARSEQVASELAVRLAPLARTFARVHVATQLIHGTLSAVRAVSEEERTELARLRLAARRIEQVAAGSTGMLALAQAGLKTELGGELLHDLAAATSRLLDEPVAGAEPAQDVFAAQGSVAAAFLRIRFEPELSPTLEDIGDAALVSRLEPRLVDDITPNDARVVPLVLAGVMAGRPSAAMTSARAVRAVLDGKALGALRSALQLSRPGTTAHVALARGARELASLPESNATPT